MKETIFNNSKHISADKTQQKNHIYKKIWFNKHN